MREVDKKQHSLQHHSLKM